MFGQASARKIFEALSRAGDQIADAMKLADNKEMRAELKDMEATIGGDMDGDGTEFGAMVRSLLTRYFDDHPILLVLDDFEQSLVPPADGVRTVVPASDFRPAITALLDAFAEADTQSRLLITSRYDFAVPDWAGNDPAANLARVPLAPMKDRERQKQIQAKARSTEQEGVIAEARVLVAKALKTARGNPGLQDALTRPILAGEPDKAEAAIETIEAFHESGKVPLEEEDVGDFFQRMAFETYTGALGRAERRVLGAATLFSEGLPVPRAALGAVASARAIAEPEPAMDRLLALGLLDDYGLMAGWDGMEPVPHLAANPLARPLGDGLADEERPRLAAAAMPELARAWGRPDGEYKGDFPCGARGIEAGVLALQADPVDPTLLDQAAEAAVIALYDLQQDARSALALGLQALARLETLGTASGPVLAGKLVNAAERVGEVALQEQLIDAALKRNDLSERLRCQFLGMRAEREIRRGDMAAAETTLSESLVHKQRAGDTRQIAITKGKIADILMRRGDLDGALAMHEERLDVAREMGDLDSIAHIQFNCARIRLERKEHHGPGIQQIYEELAEAFNINQRLQRPDGIGHIGILLGQILAAGGKRDEALQVLQASAAAFARIGQYEMAGQVKDLIAHIREGGGPSEA